MLTARRTASLLMSAALVSTGVVGIQALAPADSGLLQEAQAKVVKKSGTYSTWMCGQRTNELAAAYKVTISGSKLNVWGSMQRGNGGVMKIAKRSFKLTRATKFRAAGGDAPATKLSKAGFKSHLKLCGMNGLGLIVKVKGGKATYCTISS